MSNETQTAVKDGPKIDKLLTPSWLSGLIAVAAGLFVTTGVILVFSFNNSQAQQQLIGLQNTSRPALTLPGQNPPGTNNDSLQNTWPLLGVWAVIGLVVYFLIETIIQTFSNIAEFRAELTYVHSRRQALIRTTTEFLLLRVIAAIVWLIFIELFFRRVIPYSITAAHAAASDLTSVAAVLDILLAFGIIAFSLHLHTIFLRLSLRRTRVFSDS